MKFLVSASLRLQDHLPRDTRPLERAALLDEDLLTPHVEAHLGDAVLVDAEPDANGGEDVDLVATEDLLRGHGSTLTVDLEPGPLVNVLGEDNLEILRALRQRRAERM